MAIKVSMHNWMRPEPIERTIERLGRLGYDGIEISGEPGLYDVDHVRRLLEEHQVECWGAVTLMMGARDLCHEDRYMRIGSVEYVKDCLTLVSRLGGKIVTVVPSTVGKITPMGSPADEWRWCVESLRECQAHAETVGVRIGLEPLNRFETYFLNRCEQALALCEAVGGNMGVSLDTFHMNIEEADLIEAIHQTGDRLVDFHVADNNRMPPGHGALDWSAIVRALQTIGYQGHMTAEFVASPDRSAVSDREIGDASEAGGGPGMEKFLRDHSTGAVPEVYYDRYAQQSIDHLRAALAESASTV
ncbi:sugar phosphate isomerase/epimerase [Solirubrobacter pauli]|uniref:Sugar phosphate isomerase/epimerase n=2 Tax=Solirubrobacter pauli TaxID=166793 RepID=A0A660L325_9ACTN|nr:sugar phosphate isomerase/epimerase [Solirubrobacter pauli]RKQ87262.1 sugar phosphate isomerase/epimerase [Solirubrobacter pauli]